VFVALLVHEKFGLKEIAIDLFLVVAGLFLLLLAFKNATILYVDTQRKIITEKFFGFSVGEFAFYVIEKIAVKNTQINGLSIYTSLIICTKDSEHTISKSLNTQHLADVHTELKAVMEGNITN
jgi:hypothetical protein